MAFTKKQQTANRKIWLKALRSGEYQQGVASLHKVYDNKQYFCCLGVACDLALQRGVPLRKEYNQDGMTYSYDSHSGVLPPAVSDWLGIQSDDGFITEDKTLASLNDEGKSFKQIAVTIEKNEKKLTSGRRREAF